MRAFTIVLGLVLLVLGFALSAVFATEAVGLASRFAAVLPGFVLPALAIHVFNDGLGQLVSDLGARDVGRRISEREGLGCD